MRNRHENGGQGMNWIRREKRLAIYLRDGLACTWCGASIEEDGVRLTLDHLVPHSRGGSNAASNLVTSCHTCNSVRGSRSMETFARVVAGYTKREAPGAILARIGRLRRQRIDVTEARGIIQRRGWDLRSL